MPVRRAAPVALARIALTGLALVLLAGCGLKGDLFLPADPPAATEPGAPDDGRDDDPGKGSEDGARAALDSAAAR